MKTARLSAPWYIHRNKLANMFKYDEDVSVDSVTGDNGGTTLAVNVHVRNHAKAEALDRALRKTVEFGNVVLSVNVLDESKEQTPLQLVKEVFSYNRISRSIESEVDDTGTEHVYVVFEPGVIQFFADDTSDYRGNFNALAEDVARELFDVGPGVNFCTAAEEDESF